MIEKGETDREIYCHHLGMVTAFSYCLSMNEGLPCRNCVRCWESRVDIVALLKDRFTKDDLEKALGGLPKSRMDRILESLHEAQ